MFDIRLICKQPDVVERALGTRGVLVDLASIRLLDTEAHTLRGEFDTLHSAQRQRSKVLAELRRSKEDTAPMQSEMQAVSVWTKYVQSRVRSAKEKHQALLGGLPNLPYGGTMSRLGYPA